MEIRNGKKYINLKILLDILKIGEDEEAYGESKERLSKSS